MRQFNRNVEETSGMSNKERVKERNGVRREERRSSRKR